MKFRKHGTVQRELSLDPLPRVNLPEAARVEAVAALEAMIIRAVAEPGTARRDGGNDD